MLARKPEGSAARLATLDSFEILDSGREKAFDDVVELPRRRAPPKLAPPPISACSSSSSCDRDARRRGSRMRTGVVSQRTAGASMYIRKMAKIFAEPYGIPMHYTDDG